MTTYQHARRGGGAKVHAIGPDGQLCGSGKRRIAFGDHRRPSQMHVTRDPITCKACLKTIVKAGRG